MASTDGKKVRVEITEETLTRLLAKGQVCAADFRCLDCKSKQCLWRLCLKSCAKNWKTGIAGVAACNGSYPGCGLCSGKECGMHD